MWHEWKIYIEEGSKIKSFIQIGNFCFSFYFPNHISFPKNKIDLEFWVDGDKKNSDLIYCIFFNTIQSMPSTISFKTMFSCTKNWMENFSSFKLNLVFFKFKFPINNLLCSVLKLNVDFSYFIVSWVESKKNFNCHLKMFALVIFVDLYNTDCNHLLFSGSVKAPSHKQSSILDLL